jgi:hypothetical protein
VAVVCRPRCTLWLEAALDGHGLARPSPFASPQAKRVQRQAQEQGLGMGVPLDDVGRSALQDLRAASTGGPSDVAGVDENGQRTRGGARRGGAAGPATRPGVVGVSGRPAAPPPRASSAAAAGALTGQVQAALQAPPAPAAGGGPANTAAAFSVCVDEEFEAGSAGPVLAAFPPRLGHAPSLPGFAAVRKENAAAPGVWAGARLAQDASMVAPAAPAKLEICTDDEFKEGEEEAAAATEAAAQAAVRAAAAQQQFMRGAGPAAPVPPTMGRGSALALAGAAPSALLPPPVVAPVPGAVPSAKPLGAPAPRRAATTAAGGGASSRSNGAGAGGASSSMILGGYHEVLLVGADGKECCFEESRAAVWFARNPMPPPPPPLPQQQQQQQQPTEGEVLLASAGACAEAAAAAAAQAAAAAIAASVVQAVSGAVSPAAEPVNAAASPPAAEPATASPSAATAAAGAPQASEQQQQHQQHVEEQQQPVLLPASQAQGLQAAERQQPHPAAEKQEQQPQQQQQEEEERTQELALLCEQQSGAETALQAGEDAGQSAEGPELATAVQQAGCAAADVEAAATGDAPEALQSAESAAAPGEPQSLDDLVASRVPPVLSFGDGSEAVGAAAAAALAAAGVEGGAGAQATAAAAALAAAGGEEQLAVAVGADAAAALVAAAAAGEPTVTLSTRAALDAVNALFGADLTQSAAPPPGVAGPGGLPRGGGGGGERRSMAGFMPGGGEPTVTISTRAALASINRMFSSDLTGSAAPSPLVTRAGRPSMRFGLEGGAGFGGGGVGGGGVEPTMTLNTREAMALVNGMFCDDAPAPLGGGDVTQVGWVGFGVPGCGWHRWASCGAGAGGILRRRPEEGLGVVTGWAGTHGSLAAWHMPRSTPLSDRPHPGAPHALLQRMGRGRQSMGFALYEDTEFLSRGDAVAAAARRQRAGRRSSIAPAGGLGLYEDTEFITGRPMDAAGGSGGGSTDLGEGSGQAGAAGKSGRGCGGGDLGGLGLYEDTEFITRPMAAAARGAVALGDGPSGGAAPGHAGLGLYQDTEFLTARPSPPRPTAVRGLAPHIVGAAAPPPAPGVCQGSCAPPPDMAAAACKDTRNDENACPSPRSAASAGEGAAAVPGEGSPERAAFAVRCDSFDVMASPACSRPRLGPGPSSGVPSAGSSPDKVGMGAPSAAGGLRLPAACYRRGATWGEC